MRRWSLLWWVPPVVLGVAAALIPAEPHYSPHSFSDHLVIARRILLISAALYLWLFILLRMVYALYTAPRPENPRRGFGVIPPKSDAPNRRESEPGLFKSTADKGR